MKVLIFGLGLNQGGLGSALYFAKKGDNVRVTDLKNEKALKPSLDQLKKFKNISYTLGGHKNEDIDWADIIIKNPAVKPNNPYIERAKKLGKKIETDTGIFLQYVKPEQIIGVTGTKGKSTTSSLIYEALKAAGKKVILAGNIGKSVLDSISHIQKNTLVVLEISSFQLEAFDQHKISPKYAVITNISPDHLNYYKSMDEYISAKKIITKYQTKYDFLFIRKDSDFVSKAKIIRFSKDDLPKDFHPKLLGEHNLDNIATAYAVCKTLGIALQGQALQALENFPGVEFRLQKVFDKDGIKIYNDTAATSPEAGIKALETFPGCILICGGMNKGMDYTKYAATVSQFVKKVFFLEGDSTLEIQRILKNHSQTYNDLEKLLRDVKKEVKEGDIILFSPAATSFNLFQNEFDRGRKFNRAVEKVFGASIS
jgi:UDP-N-acetylmuramoylalanine--D-glutamate ligase